MPCVLRGHGASLPRQHLPSAPGAADSLYGALHLVLPLHPWRRRRAVAAGTRNAGEASSNRISLLPRAPRELQAVGALTPPPSSGALGRRGRYFGSVFILKMKKRSQKMANTVKRERGGDEETWVPVANMPDRPSCRALVCEANNRLGELGSSQTGVLGTIQQARAQELPCPPPSEPRLYLSRVRSHVEFPVKTGFQL